MQPEVQACPEAVPSRARPLFDQAVRRLRWSCPDTGYGHCPDERSIVSVWVNQLEAPRGHARCIWPEKLRPHRGLTRPRRSLVDHASSAPAHRPTTWATSLRGAGSPGLPRRVMTSVEA